MKKYLFLVLSIIGSFQQCHALEALGSDLHQSLKVNPAEPNMLSIVFSLLVVIFLIYITGLIYTKLNIAGATAVKKQLKNYDLSKVVVLSTTQLGQHKNLHVIEINNHRLLIGATPESINLIKNLGENKTNETETHTTVDEAINVLYNEDKSSQSENMKDLNQEKMKPRMKSKVNEEPFSLHKKYL